MGKQRPKFARIGRGVNAVTPEKTVNYETYIKYIYAEKYKGMMFEENEPLKIKILAYKAPPSSTSKKKTKLMLENILRPTKKPDWDNIGKIVGDALNKVAYPDDKQIVDAHIVKYYDTEPRAEITITSLLDEGCLIE